MARTYSEEFLLALGKNENEERNLGIDLAKLCVAANLPLAYVAKAMGASRLTVFNWFRGANISLRKQRDVVSFMGYVEKGMAEGKLPAKNTFEAKTFIVNLIECEF